MTDTVFLNRAPETPTGTASASGASLPPEVLAEASARLGWAGLIYSTTYTLAYFGPHVIAAATTRTTDVFRMQSAFAAVSIAMGFAVFWLSRTKRLGPQQLLDLGLVFEVVGAFGVCIAEFWTGFPETTYTSRAYLGVPWEAVWIIIFPLVAPNTPRKMLVAALAAASAGPITLYLANRFAGAPVGSPATVVVTYFLFTSYLSAALAYLIARLMYRYNVQLKRAREIGSYELLRALGHGGMGEVWAARHRLLARPAAIKLIRPELLGADPRSRQIAIRRFEREARATASMGSVHTVDVYDFGLTNEGAFFYVMELLDGVSLDALVKRFGPLPADRAVHLLIQVCHSLSEAHARGLIHRDIKPANIFVCRLGPDYDFAKVLDFGLVKQSAGEQSIELTAEGITAGTPAFMAPEMALGKAEVDGRADIYALGCVAYWLVTGKYVFQGSTPVATILEHVRSEPVPPSRRTEVAIPPALEDVIMSCLAKDPADRPQNAEILGAVLEATGIAETWTIERARKWWDLHQPESFAPSVLSDASLPVQVIEVSLPRARG